MHAQYIDQTPQMLNALYLKVVVQLPGVLNGTASRLFFTSFLNPIFTVIKLAPFNRKYTPLFYKDRQKDAQKFASHDLKLFAF
jgi:hypothetical protein